MAVLAFLCVWIPMMAFQALLSGNNQFPMSHGMGMAFLTLDTMIDNVSFGVVSGVGKAKEWLVDRVFVIEGSVRRSGAPAVGALS